MNSIHGQGLIIIILVTTINNVSTMLEENKFSKSHSLWKYGTDGPCIPLRYKIRIRPVLLENYKPFVKNTAPAEVSIRVRAVENGKKITFGQERLRIKQDGVRVFQVGKTGTVNHLNEKTIWKQSFSGADKSYSVELIEPFKAGDELEIFIPYVAPLINDFGESSWGFLINRPEAARNGSYAITRMIFDGGKKVFPTLGDLNSSKMKYEIIIGRLQGKYKSLSNMDLTHTEPDLDFPGWVWDYYKPSFPVSLEHVFMFVSDFKNYTLYDSTLNITVSVWTPKSSMKNTTARLFTSKTASKYLWFFANVLKLQYPLSNLDIIYQPSKFEATALGKILISRNHFNCESDSVTQRAISNHLAESIASQFFGVVVPVSDAWSFELTSGIPSYVTSLAVVAMNNSLKVLENGTSVSVLTETSQSPERITSQLLKMMEDFLSVEIMKTALTDVYRTCMWKDKTLDDFTFLEAVQAAVDLHNATHLLPSSETTVQQIMMDWIEQLSTEYPLVKVTGCDGDASNNCIALTQEKFNRFHKAQKHPPPSGNWWIPIFISTGSGFVDRFWLPRNVSGNFTYTGNRKVGLDLDTDKWFMLNANSIGYYRVLYDDKPKEVLVRQLISDHTVFSREGRLQLMSDYCEFYESKYLPVKEVLEITQYLGKETSSRLWKVVLNRFISTFYSQLREHNQSYQTLRRYMVPRMSSALDIKGGISSFNNTSFLTWCFQLEVHTCVDFALELMEKWKVNPDKLSSNLDDISMISVHIWQCTVISSDVNSKSDKNNWTFLLNKFFEVTDVSTKIDYFTALSCSQNSSRIDQLLQLTLTFPEIQFDLIKALIMSSRKIETRRDVFEFLKVSLTNGKTSPEMFSKVVELMASVRFTLHYENFGEELEQFIDNNMKLLEVVRPSLEYSLAEIYACVGSKWWDDIGHNITHWLSKHLS